MRSKALKTNFGIDIDRYERILATQGGVCAICGALPSERTRAFAVDHDHACCPSQQTCGNCIRGIICSSCNLILGAIGDRIDVIIGMARYLRQGEGMLL
jgi:hypothetical protein